MLIPAIAALLIGGSQVIGEPTGKTPVEVVHHGDDVGGQRLAYLLRDRFRASASYEVSATNAIYRVVITSMDTTQITAGPSTTYAVVLTAAQNGEGFGYPEAYITSAVYSCPVRQLSECAQTVYVDAATELELAAKEYRDAANEAIERMYRDAGPGQ